MVLILGVILVVMGLKGLTAEGFWITNTRQVRGPVAKAVSIGAIVLGVAVIVYVVFIRTD